MQKDFIFEIISLYMRAAASTCIYEWLFSKDNVRSKVHRPTMVPISTYALRFVNCDSINVDDQIRSIEYRSICDIRFNVLNVQMCTVQCPSSGIFYQSGFFYWIEVFLSPYYAFEAFNALSLSNSEIFN